MIGCPAKQAGWMSEYAHRLEFDAEGNASCLESGDKYILNDNRVKKL